ncbi:hypothetical protein GCM10023084_16470 [Streptomyces lacrimifluminis]|uniref:Uncharacterized protein n=1 Tax=Streptomyces lacrimifluminis TaxID=1500077 RepID=A0A917KD65_9ACTN|nr:hypothetical protein GCM10012282_00840 [Streptomyces lacrimifluminis]
MASSCGSIRRPYHRAPEPVRVRADAPHGIHAGPCGGGGLGNGIGIGIGIMDELDEAAEVFQRLSPR